MKDSPVIYEQEMMFAAGEKFSKWKHPKTYFVSFGGKLLRWGNIIL